MERIWSSKERTFIEMPVEITNFFDEIEAVCKKHNISIGHEDSHGSFIIYQEFDESIVEWLRGASLGNMDE